MSIYDRTLFESDNLQHVSMAAHKSSWLLSLAYDGLNNRPDDLTDEDFEAVHELVEVVRALCWQTSDLASHSEASRPREAIREESARAQPAGGVGGEHGD